MRDPYAPCYYILDKQHRVVEVDDPLVWGRWHDDINNRRVALDHGHDKDGDWELSSVCLGLDHSFDEHGPPIIFETMLFRKDKSASDDGDCWRFATWQETMSFHKRKVAELRGIRLVRRA